MRRGLGARRARPEPVRHRVLASGPVRVTSPPTPRYASHSCALRERGVLPPMGDQQHRRRALEEPAASSSSNGSSSRRRKMEIVDPWTAPAWRRESCSRSSRRATWKLVVPPRAPIETKGGWAERLGAGLQPTAEVRGPPSRRLKNWADDPHQRPCAIERRFGRPRGVRSGVPRRLRLRLRSMRVAV